jgi:hypothetical protein
MDKNKKQLNMQLEHMWQRASHQSQMKIIYNELYG